MRPSRVGALIGSLAAAAAAVYLFVYLYRWEFHRASIAGLLLVAVEVGAGSLLILERLRRVEERLDRLERPSTHARALAEIEAATPEPRRPFAWLPTKGGELGVFVPILLGAGVVLSGMAWVIERFARATAQPLMARSLAVRLSPLLVGPGVVTGAPRIVADPPRRDRARHVAAMAFATATAVAAVVLLADLTQDRPEAQSVSGLTVVSLEVESRSLGERGGSIDTARSVWASCSTALRRADLPVMVETAPGTVEILVRPALSERELVRVRGCLEDGGVDRLRARLRAIDGLRG